MLTLFLSLTVSTFDVLFDTVHTMWVILRLEIYSVYLGKKYAMSLHGFSSYKRLAWFGLHVICPSFNLRNSLNIYQMILYYVNEIWSLTQDEY